MPRIPLVRSVCPTPPTAAILIAVFAAGAAGPDPLHAQESTQESTLEVSGRGEVEVAPDRARISFAVETEGASAREAGEANARLMDRVLAAVRETGAEGLRTETSGYSLRPRYRQGEDQAREISGYTASNALQVITDDVERVGALVDTALEAGANRVAGLFFEIRDTEPHRRDALRQAVDRARGEAQVMAEALGVRLGDPVRVQGGAERPPPQPFQAARAEMAMADAPSTPVEAGLQTVSASVTITYRLHPE